MLFRWYQTDNYDEMQEIKTKPADLEQQFRSDANGATFARIIDAIRKSHRIEQMM